MTPTPGGLNQATPLLFAAMIDSLRALNARSIITVTDVRMERILTLRARSAFNGNPSKEVRPSWLPTEGQCSDSPRGSV
ncbi:hypothetical protein QOU61_22185 [Bradyrhizobium sp. NP1]|nr:hypothetical protein [Bradyrhizobium sp. NP1]WJR75506.1 hypothetical protein QOU61_22185 [Bradyrhizobium sp. NP1]